MNHSESSSASSNDDNNNGNDNNNDNDNDNDATMTTPAESLDRTTDSLSSSLNRLNRASQTAVAIANRYASIDPPRDDDDDDDDDDDTPTNPWRNMPNIEEDLRLARSGLEEAWRDSKACCERERGTNNDDDDDDESDDDDVTTNANANSGVTVTVDLDMEADIDGVGENGDYGDTSDSDDGEEKDDSSDTDILPEEDFRALYMNMMTETFGDALDQIKEQGESETTGSPIIDVDILVESLQSGIDFLEPHEKNRTSFFESLGYYDGSHGEKDQDMGDDNNNNNETKDEGLTVHELRKRELGYLVPSGGDDEQ